METRGWMMRSFRGNDPTKKQVNIRGVMDHSMTYLSGNGHGL